MHNEKDVSLQIPCQAKGVFWAITEHKQENKKKVKTKMKAVSELFRNLYIRTELKGEDLHGWTLKSPKEGNETDGMAAGGNDFFCCFVPID